MQKLRRALSLLDSEQTPWAPLRVDGAIFAVVVAGAVALAGADFIARHIVRNLTELADIDGQKNPTTWFQSSVLLGAAISAFVLIATLPRVRQRVTSAVLGAGLAFFSLDKSISLHEQVGRGLVDAFSLSQPAARIAWELAWAPIIALTALALLICVWEANRTTKLWAAGMLAGGGIKLAMEAAMFPAIRLLGVSQTGALYGLEAELEESIQLLAFGALFAGLAQLAVDRLWERARAAGAPELAAQQLAVDERRPVPLRRLR